MEMWSLLLLSASVLSAGGSATTAKPIKAAALHEHPTLRSMLTENNRLRTSVGLPPQKISPALTKAAQDHAWYMARTGNLSHQSNGGALGRAQRHGFGGLASENIAQGQPTVSSVFRSWRASGGHWANIKSNSRLAGFGYGISPHGEKFWVAMYGN